MLKKETLPRLVIVLGFFVILSLNYLFVVIPEYGYMGFTNGSNVFNIIISLFWALFFIALGANIREGLYRTIWYIILMYLLFPNLIFFAFSSGDFSPVYGYSIFLIILLAINYIRIPTFKVPTIDILENRNNFYMLLGISFLLSLPYLMFADFLSINNLFLKEIYITRAQFRSIEYPLGLGYLIGPLARVLLLFLLVNSIIKKRLFSAVLIIFLISFLFLASGAIKSILLGIVCVAVFYFGKTYNSKIRIFIYVFGSIAALGILENYIFDSTYMSDLFIRRFFFTPPRLETVYYTFFDHNHTFYSHSFLRNFVEYPYELDLSRHIGEVVMGKKDSNANVGVIIDGFISLGWTGVILHSIVMGFLLKFITQLSISEKYFGIIFAYIYYLNTAFIGPYFITHGFLFLILFCLFIFKPHVSKV